MLNQLKNLGLTENEAKVYLAMLELGPAPVLEISAKAGINRPTTYFQIEALKKLGLVSSLNKGIKQLFVAESPEQLEFILNKELKLVEQKKTDLSKLLPELQTIFNLAEEKPLIRFFEGTNGLLRMQDEFLKSKDKEILAISSLDDVLKVFPDHPDTYSPKRVQKKIISKLIYTTSRGPFLKEKDKKMLRESRYVAPDKLPFSSDITVFDDKVAIAALKGTISGTIIQHKEIANSFKGLFKLSWDLVNKI